MDFSQSSSSSFPTTTIEKRRRGRRVRRSRFDGDGVWWSSRLVFALSGVSLVSSNRPDVEKSFTSFTSFWGRRIRGGFFMAEEEGDDAWDGPVPEPTYEEDGNVQNKEEEEEEEEEERKKKNRTTTRSSSIRPWTSESLIETPECYRENNDNDNNRTREDTIYERTTKRVPWSADEERRAQRRPEEK